MEWCLSSCVCVNLTMHSYSADLLALRQRAGPSSAYNFLEVKQHVAAAANRVLCVVGGPGEGKSTLAAMMLENAGDTFVHAAHFCKRADTNRQVSVLITSLWTLSLAFLALLSHPWAAADKSCLFFRISSVYATH